jgi:nucleoside-diphosphate-sugar epimerase
VNVPAPDCGARPCSTGDASGALNLKYTHVIAADIAAADTIGGLFGYSNYVQPLQIDLAHLIQPSPPDGSPEALTQLALKHLLSEQVAAIYHVAGCVDTRESPSVCRRLFDINARVTSALASIASSCGVLRFVHVSSAAAVHTKLPGADTHIPFYFRLLPRPSMLSQTWSASVQSSRFSSYSASKFEGELKVLQVTKSSSSSVSSSNMRACVVRPHVIWGAHDPLSTEMLLSWPQALPLVLIGDLDSEVVAVRVDNVAQYILMADAALFSDASLSGQVFNIGDERIRLGNLNARIVMLGRQMTRTRAVCNTQQLRPAPFFHVESRDRLVAFSFGCLWRVECTTSTSHSASPLQSTVERFWVVIIPQVVLFLLLLIIEFSEICFGMSRFGVQGLFKGDLGFWLKSHAQLQSAVQRQQLRVSLLPFVLFYSLVHLLFRPSPMSLF